MRVDERLHLGAAFGLFCLDDHAQASDLLGQFAPLDFVLEVAQRARSLRAG
jgi:hypothetical protein